MYVEYGVVLKLIILTQFLLFYFHKASHIIAEGKWINNSFLAEVITRKTKESPASFNTSVQELHKRQQKKEMKCLQRRLKTSSYNNSHAQIETIVSAQDRQFTIGTRDEKLFSSRPTLAKRGLSQSHFPAELNTYDRRSNCIWTNNSDWGTTCDLRQDENDAYLCISSRGVFFLDYFYAWWCRCNVYGKYMVYRQTQVSKGELPSDIFFTEIFT